MLGLTLSSKLDMGSYIISTPKALQEIESLIHSMKFLSPEVALYLYKSTIRSCMEYCYHVWAGASSCYLELFDATKTNMRGCWPITCCFSSTFGSLSKCSQLKSFLQVICRYSSELAEMVPFPYSQVRSTRYSNRLHDFSVTIPRSQKDAYANSFFLCTVRLWKSLPITHFPLSYDLNSF